LTTQQPRIYSPYFEEYSIVDKISQVYAMEGFIFAAAELV